MADVNMEEFQTNEEELEQATSFWHQNKKSWIIIAIAAIVSMILFYVMPYDVNAKKGLCLLVFIAVLWLSEAVHITITALMVPVLTIILGIQNVAKDGTLSDLSIKTILTNFADPTIFLFFGGFALATALHIQKIDKKIASKIISMSGSNLGYAVIAICVATAGLSMWISNTATAAMMLPLAIGILSNLDEEKDRNTFTFVLLAIAFSASIGGLGTIVGSPPNAIVSSALGYSFTDWMKIGIPLMLIIFPTMLIVLYVVFKPNLNTTIQVDKVDHIPWTQKRILTLVVFGLTAFFWIFSKNLSTLLGMKITDALVALVAASAIGVLGLAKWKEIAHGTDWGILMLFGGGLALSMVLKNSGASAVLGLEVSKLFGTVPLFVVILVTAIFILVLTEFTSNTASAALLVPIFATIATELGLPKESLVVVIGVGASCAFMLPVATPPNAIVFGTGYISQKQMLKAGGVLNTFCIAIITLYTYFFLT
ncbi:NadC family protein [Campylobacter sputorum subsp. bubulus]|uniref:NadC family protein n=2 Tax=Campylobacter sputorum TaxID=206 RepID=A0A381DIN7_9BACT|nr:DASS family sodium/dicarboxylate symporter [Campylobacter sputorum aubsp. sputorum RM3237]QEL05734.1 sodium:dicarboxylate cotransporter (permease SLC13 domain) [Campylobacter sputorum subsp. sputorum]SUX08200.1 NadC family protein [Campylobacter sputorum subsp. bubulus]SUX10505.1 NadC family protein [Campylobacter sputorum subsp. sputorum]